MGKSKIIYNGQTLIDLTGDTVTAETLLEGITAHGADGEAILGAMKAGGSLTVLSGTARPNTSSQDQLLINCALPEANFMLLNVEPAATISQTSTSLVSHVNYLENDGVVLAKSVWGGKTLSSQGSAQLTIDHENGIVSSPASGGGRPVVSYSNVDYRWWYVYG